MIPSIKILIVGNWMWPWYEKACARSLEALGCSIVPYGWFSEFHEWQPDKVEPVYRSFGARLQNRLLIGPKLSAVNRKLLELTSRVTPDVIWFFNSTHIFPSTIEKIKTLSPKILLVQYSNDNPFSSHLKPDRWRYLKRSIANFDLHFAYRHSNMQDLKEAGAENVDLLRSYFIPTEDFFDSDLQNDLFKCDVVFAGHYEDDGRLGMLSALAGAGIGVNIFGGGWNGAHKFVPSGHPLSSCFPITPVVGPDYRKAICGSKIALCFLSKINKDTYTRRNFQIPAMKTFMLSEYSEDLASLFVEGVEAEFFRSKDELREKIKFYLANDKLRQEIAEAGHKRVMVNGHDVNSRMRFFLNTVKSRLNS